MLSLLHIENIAIIESADLSFDGGFNVLTGETGAGKSIVIDSISAVLGERTSRELIRTGAKSAVVNAVFTGSLPVKWLEDNGFPVDGEELMLQREIHGDGRNACRVNGREPVNTALTSADLAPVRITSRLVLSPNTALMESITMDFPAPVSPVSTLNPLSKLMSADSIMAMFSM